MISAPISNRFFACLIDMFFVYLLRFFYINISIELWLRRSIEMFMEKYKILYGAFNLKKITLIEVYYFLNSSLFRELVIFVIGIFLIGVAYNLLFLSTKWSATIGQKLLGMYAVSKSGRRMRFYQIILRSFAVILPWFFMFVVLFCKSLADFGVKGLIDKTSFVVSIIAFISWYDLIFLTKNKLVFHDLLTGTRVIVRNNEKYEDNPDSLWKVLFPNFKDMYIGLKEFTKNQIEKARKIKEEYKERKKSKKKDS